MALSSVATSWPEASSQRRIGWIVRFPREWSHEPPVARNRPSGESDGAIVVVRTGPTGPSTLSAGGDVPDPNPVGLRRDDLSCHRANRRWGRNSRSGRSADLDAGT